MKTVNIPVSTCQHCRHCRHFMPEGRRGGNCEQLGAPVRGVWKACSLAIPAFAPSWEVLEGMGHWSGETRRVTEVVPKKCLPTVAVLDEPTDKSMSESEELTTELVVV